MRLGKSISYERYRQLSDKAGVALDSVQAGVQLIAGRTATVSIESMGANRQASASGAWRKVAERVTD